MLNDEYMEFNVSVTTQNKTEIDAKGKFGIFVIRGQIGGSKKSNDESINRIKFKVFITEK